MQKAKQSRMFINQSSKMNNTAQHIVAVHLYNDYSGSPRILGQWLNHAVGQGQSVELHTSDTAGILDEVREAKRRTFSYRPRKNKVLTLIHFLRIQMLLFWRISQISREGRVVYVNTILPFGAILGARLRGIPVVCHVHEVSVRPRLLNAFLKKIAMRSSRRLIFVSDYVANHSGMQNDNSVTIPNALSPEFLQGVLPADSTKSSNTFRVLMLASIREYKGLNQFLELAKRLPQVAFELVLNGTEEEATAFFEPHSIPDNLRFWPSQTNVHPFYARAHLVLNLSLPDQWIETFGLTALEAMAYGLPAIVPPVGGIAELVVDGESGYHCDSYDVSLLADLVEELRTNSKAYQTMATAAESRGRKYRFQDFALAIDQIIHESSLRKFVPNRDVESALGS